MDESSASAAAVDGARHVGRHSEQAQPQKGQEAEHEYPRYALQ